MIRLLPVKPKPVVSKTTGSSRYFQAEGLPALRAGGPEFYTEAGVIIRRRHDPRREVIPFHDLVVRNDSYHVTEIVAHLVQLVARHLHRLPADGIVGRRRGIVRAAGIVRIGRLVLKEICYRLKRNIEDG